MNWFTKLAQHKQSPVQEMMDNMKVISDIVTETGSHDHPMISTLMNNIDQTIRKIIEPQLDNVVAKFLDEIRYQRHPINKPIEIDRSVGLILYVSRTTQYRDNQRINFRITTSGGINSSFTMITNEINNASLKNNLMEHSVNLVKRVLRAYSDEITTEEISDYNNLTDPNRPLYPNYTLNRLLLHDPHVIDMLRRYMPKDTDSLYSNRSSIGIGTLNQLPYPVKVYLTNYIRNKIKEQSNLQPNPSPENGNVTGNTT